MVKLNRRSISKLQTICLFVLIVLMKADNVVLSYLPQEFKNILSQIILRRRNKLNKKRQKRSRGLLLKRYMKLSEHRRRHQWYMYVTITERDIDFTNFYEDFV